MKFHLKTRKILDLVIRESFKERNKDRISIQRWNPKKNKEQQKIPIAILRKQSKRNYKIHD